MSENVDSSIEELLSRTKIAELTSRYCFGVDRRDSEAFLSIWHPDAEYVIGPKRGRFVGIAEIERSQSLFAERYGSTHHWPTSHVIDFVDSDHATGLSDAFAICVTLEGEPVLVAASYDDQYERRSEWRFLRRAVTRWFVSEPLSLTLHHPQR